MCPIGSVGRIGMSGHSKWTQIKRKKALTDARKGRLFSKLSRLIEVAAGKGSDSKTNLALKEAIEQARTENMPTANIERAIKKGGGLGRNGAGLDEVVYEAYGPGGVALLIKAVTANRKRTAAEIKHILSRHASHLAEAGSVKWLFEKKGILRLSREKNSRAAVEELAILNDAENVLEEENMFEVVVSVENLGEFKQKAAEKGLSVLESALEWRAKNMLKLNVQDEAALAALLSDLDDQEDITDVYTNS